VVGYPAILAVCGGVRAPGHVVVVWEARAVSIEYLLARLTAQTNWKDKQMPGGGVPELSVADISVIAAAAPHPSFHALMAKYCDDQASESAIIKWTHEHSRKEWFTNPDLRSIRFEARQLNLLDELAVLAWLNQASQHAVSISTRAAYVGVNHETFRRNFQEHFAFLVGELGLIEQIGTRAVYEFKGKRDSLD
jgi:hypothetical protein